MGGFRVSRTDQVNFFRWPTPLHMCGDQLHPWSTDLLAEMPAHKHILRPTEFQPRLRASRR